MRYRRVKPGYPVPTDECCKGCKVQNRQGQGILGLCLFYAFSDKNADFDAWMAELKAGASRLRETTEEFVALQSDRRALYRTLRRLEAALNRHMVECFELRERMIGILNVRFKGRGIGKTLVQLKDEKLRAEALARIERNIGRSEIIRKTSDILRKMDTEVMLRNSKTHSWHPRMMLDDGRWLYDPFEFWAEVKGTRRRRLVEDTLRRDIVALSERYARKCRTLLAELAIFEALCSEGYQLRLPA